MNDGWVVILTALIAAAPGVYAIIAGRRKARAESDKTSNDDLRATNAQLASDNQRLRENIRAFDDELKTLRLELAAMRREYDAEIDKLRAENAKLRAQYEAEIGELQRGVLALIRQVEDMGKAPIYKPRAR